MDKELDREEMRAIEDHKGKTIISIKKGKKLGTLDDVLIDPDTIGIAALVTSRGWLPWRDLKAIPAEEVRVWGEDVILVETPDVVRKEKELPETDRWLSVSDDVVGRDVITTDGDKVSEIDDALMNPEGKLIGFRLSQIGYALDTVLAEGPGPKVDWIANEAVHSMGKDVLIIDKEKIKTTG